ncbi:hypothetical protein AAH979_01785 [Plantactinospora sp. ZYX-F-223]|uniref:hypothetical protein n=1 Tax=Plantactinospora sp. ZYX-F-223 TaxID=3144103 RepID=UPI0031FBB344
MIMMMTPMSASMRHAIGRSAVRCWKRESLVGSLCTDNQVVAVTIAKATSPTASVTCSLVTLDLNRLIQLLLALALFVS